MLSLKYFRLLLGMMQVRNRTDGGGGEGGGGEGGRRRGWPAARAEAAIREVASGDTKTVVPGPMVTLVMITKSLGSAISVEQFVLLAPA